MSLNFKLKFQRLIFHPVKANDLCSGAMDLGTINTFRATTCDATELTNGITIVSYRREIQTQIEARRSRYFPTKRFGLSSIAVLNQE